MTRHRHLALHITTLAGLSAILPGTAGPSGAVAIEDLDMEDVPSECVQACAPIVQLTGRCEVEAEQQFGTDRRWIGQRQVVDSLGTETRRRRGKRRLLHMMLGTRLSGRQDGEEEDERDDSDDSDDEEETLQTRPDFGNAGETERNRAASSAMRACVCGERDFDVAGAAFGCARCVAQNGTAVEASEGQYPANHRRVRLRRRVGSSDANDDNDNDRATASSTRACDKHTAAGVSGVSRAVYIQHNNVSINDPTAGCWSDYAVLCAAASTDGAFWSSDLFDTAFGRSIFNAEFQIDHTRHGVRDTFVQRAATYRLARRYLDHAPCIGRKPNERYREGVRGLW
ncbi:uncharacterized protein ColSpa_05435 [Colletotrichum spaethianum]|uniref:Uncharacterized protein n=1 Tax=Colletotrichum spaethianum TaxID=700344 RepID=A0AA37LF28_9PEZI|nr:uncharacterized protein ColSpa_05435 [Colletotrichum spaethianum]GKT45254.1 hypothetical protein ColSpa_05435 [Colletotrichum spaethianum]